MTHHSLIKLIMNCILFLYFIFLARDCIRYFFIKGDFDPTKTKVLHFAGNPLALSRKLHAQELENLRDENEDLRRKIKALEQQDSGSSVAQSSLPSDTQSDDGKQVQG